MNLRLARDIGDFINKTKTTNQTKQRPSAVTPLVALATQEAEAEGSLLSVHRASVWKDRRVSDKGWWWWWGDCT